MKIFLLSPFLFIAMSLASNAQTVDIQYLNPKFGTGDPHKYVRFGTSTEYYAGFMWNNNHDTYGNGNDFTIFTYGDRDITFRTGAGNFIVFPSAGGSMGIGTTNPGAWKLAVNGKIRAKEIKVDTGWSDFVFEGDYNLPTLEEVEQHIQKNGHLKDIPSAKEVEENGIFLGEMDAKLLQKIEELTLYTIQQQKQIEALLEQSKKQQEEINELKKR